MPYEAMKVGDLMGARGCGSPVVYLYTFLYGHSTMNVCFLSLWHVTWKLRSTITSSFMGALWWFESLFRESSLYLCFQKGDRSVVRSHFLIIKHLLFFFVENTDPNHLNLWFQRDDQFRFTAHTRWRRHSPPSWGGSSLWTSTDELLWWWLAGGTSNPKAWLYIFLEDVDFF